MPPPQYDRRPAHRRQPAVPPPRAPFPDTSLPRVQALRRGRIGGTGRQVGGTLSGPQRLANRNVLLDAAMRAGWNPSHFVGPFHAAPPLRALASPPTRTLPGYVPPSLAGAGWPEARERGTY